MQGGDFLYGSAGAPKDEQQPNTIEKKGKKNFQLSKILPSPSKKGSQSTKQASSEIVQDVSLPSNEKKRPRAEGILKLLEDLMSYMVESGSKSSFQNWLK